MNGKALIDALLQRPEVSEHIDSLREHHQDSAEHSVRVGISAAELGYKNELPEEDIETLGLAGLLHDLGKHAIPDEILSKPAELDDSERSAISGHPRQGFIKLDHPSFENVRKIVVGHHEYKTGPYPRTATDRRSVPRETEDRRNGDEKIGILTQILAAVDMFDALKSRRAYKEPFSKETIGKIMREEFTGDKLFVEQLLG